MLIKTQGVFDYESESIPYKNFMVFVSQDPEKLGYKLREGDPDYHNKHDVVIDYLKAQVDNSLECNWDPKDIIIATNFDFEYKGVKAHILDEVCDYSHFFHKQYATLELMRKGVFEDANIWYHDLDAFQLEPFTFPEFNGDWGTCVYPYGDGHSCQCGVFYLKPTTEDMFEYLVTKMKARLYNTNDDELVIRNDIKLNPNYFDRVSVLDTSYNMGMTGFDDRYKNAVKPIKVVHFHPEDKKQWDYMAEGKNNLGVKILNDRLINILSPLRDSL
jgi:hypothetical protein